MGVGGGKEAGIEERGEKQVDSGFITQARNQIPLEKITTSSEDFQTSEVESKGRKRICPFSPGDVSVRGTEAKGPPPSPRGSRGLLCCPALGGGGGRTCPGVPDGGAAGPGTPSGDFFARKVHEGTGSWPDL